MAAVGFNLMFGKRAFGTNNLAATAETATATDRINIHPQYPGRMEQRRVDRKAAAASGGGKYNLDHLLWHSLSPAATATSDATGSLCGRFAVGAYPVGTVRVIAHHDIATAHGLHHFWVQWAGNGGCHTGTHGHR